MRKKDWEKQLNNRNPFSFYQDDENPFFNNMNVINSRTITVIRNEEFETGYERLINANLKALYKIQYINEHGVMEPGIDGGGIQKEFITTIIK